MSIAGHHAEWLSLVPVSGPFLSLPVLMEAFSAGLEPHDPEHMRLLRQACADWQEALEKRKSDPAPHQHWIGFVLAKTLDLDDRVLAEGQAVPQTLQTEVAEHHELLRPNIVVVDPNTKKPRLLVQTYPRSQELSSHVANSRWKASPDTRMTELLHATGVRLGLVTNGEHWMLVDAPKGETTGYASWYATLWLEEPITLRAFRSLLSAGRFFNVPDDQTLEALLAKSASNQQEVTDQLGYQVRRAVEVLIHSLDRADQDFGRELLAGVPEAVLYESALTVMMRLVFLFCAEERELIPSKPFPVYEQNYSVSTISKQLRELAFQHGEELLERRHDAWPRLLAAFRAVYGGLRHDDVHIPAYGGNLFNPDRFPFLEGRKRGTSWKDSEANPLPVNNRTVLHLLEALQLLQVRVPGGGPAEARRLSFRALDIEQIGHVYEGLLDHTAKRAAEPFLGLIGTREKEPELPLAELEKLLAKGEAELMGFLAEETGKSEKALKKSIKVELDPQDAARFRTACQGDDALWKRVEPLAGLVRLDNFGYPVVIPKGCVFVTAGTDRRSSGTHYTPRSLTEPIVQYTLEPLVYIGPAEGKPKEEWKLRPAKELLDLKICDMACGSGAFLVQACRYLSERLLEAWENEEKAEPGRPRIAPEGKRSEGDPTEKILEGVEDREVDARRLIAQRCLYGVDKNPLAVEMAKLSLWLLTLAKDKPFEFLDHSIRCGDSLVGLSNIEQLRSYSLQPDEPNTIKFSGPLDAAVDEAISLRLKLEDLPSNTVEDVERQEKLLKEANEKIARLRCAADLLVAGEFWGENAKDKAERVRHNAVRSGHYVEVGPTEEFEQAAAKERRGQFMFHWPLEFPEVIVKRSGFDAFVGNPPFMGGQKISGNYGENYRDHLVAGIAGGEKGSADLCAYFFLRSMDLLRHKGNAGLLATNTLGQGDTREVGLARVIQKGATIYRATPSLIWPGNAAVFIAVCHIHNGEWLGPCWLNGGEARHISSLLDTDERVAFPYRLAANSNRSFMGTQVHGLGFLLTPSEADELVAADPRNRKVIRPYLEGVTVNKKPDQSAERWVIDFTGMSESEAAAFPACYEILVKRAKAERQALEGRNSSASTRAKLWWRFSREAKDLYDAIQGWKSVLVTARVSRTCAFVRVGAKQVLNDKLIVFALQEYSGFAILQSSLHYCWCWTYASTLKGDLNYSQTDCFETFPFPHDVYALEDVGVRYHTHRSDIMLTRQDGLTKTSNRFHDSEQTSTDIQKLRALHVEMDRAVAAAYGWTDLDLGHGFHETKQGVRYTISEPARREVLARLLKLNHQRYAEEVKQGLHDTKKTKPAAKPKPRKATATPEATLFDPAFPSTDRDKALCGLLCDLVAVEPKLRFDAYSDALMIAVRPKVYEGMLPKEDRKPFVKLVESLKVADPDAPLPWRDIKDTLLANGAIEDVGYLFTVPPRMTRRSRAWPGGL